LIEVLPSNDDAASTTDLIIRRGPEAGIEDGLERGQQGDLYGARRTPTDALGASRERRRRAGVRLERRGEREAIEQRSG
jgi:hypothetical protein